MPINTDKAATTKIRLLICNAVSRLMNWGGGVALSAGLLVKLKLGARQANKIKGTPSMTTIMARMMTPLVGSLVKACTEVSKPERTINVPIKLKPKPNMASSTAHSRNILRFSTTTSEWMRAVAINHGMREAFSTGSQNHHPPQPSS